MKKISLVLFLSAATIYTACAQNKANSQQKEITPQYTGPISKQEFLSAYTKKWFNKNYEEYKPDQVVLAEIKKKIQPYSIKVFMGNWCPDSRRETPKLFKLLDEAGFDERKLSVYAMNREKTTDANYEEGLQVEFVPTIIFFDKKGEEVNRFVEFPQESLEKDILKIISGETYKNSYAE